MKDIMSDKLKQHWLEQTEFDELSGEPIYYVGNIRPKTEEELEYKQEATT